jgi:hypothetical protein
MEWQIMVALAVMIPVILVPVLFVWFLNIGGMYAILKRVRERRAAWSKRRVEEQINTGQ